MNKLEFLEAQYGDEATSIIKAMRQGRDIALEGAISTCQELAKEGGSARQCVKALQRIRSKLTNVNVH